MGKEKDYIISSRNKMENMGPNAQELEYVGPSTDMKLAMSAEKSARAGGRDFSKSKRRIVQEKPANSEIYGAPYELSGKDRNKVADTKMAKAKYADKPPKINLRKAYSE